MDTPKYTVGQEVRINLKHEADLSKISYPTSPGLPIGTHITLILEPGVYVGTVSSVVKTDFGFYCIVKIKVAEKLFIKVSVSEIDLNTPFPEG